MIVISDTSAITNWAAIQQLHLLPQLYDRVIIFEAVALYDRILEMVDEV